MRGKNTGFAIIDAMHIETPRFLLRDFLEQDRQQFVDYQMDERYRRLYDLNETDVHRPGKLFDLFHTWLGRSPRLNFQGGIFELETSRLCGCAGLRLEGQPRGVAILGLELAPDFWGRYGLATGVTSALIEYGFHALGLDTITGTTANGNSRVERLAQWFGATIGDCRNGPAWMKTRGWQEVDWALRRDAWTDSPARRRLFKAKLFFG